MFSILDIGFLISIDIIYSTYTLRKGLALSSSKERNIYIYVNFLVFISESNLINVLLQLCSTIIRTMHASNRIVQHEGVLSMVFITGAPYSFNGR